MDRIIRGYFGGDGQHWYRIWDMSLKTFETGYYRTRSEAEKAM